MAKSVRLQHKSVVCGLRTFGITVTYSVRLREPGV